MGPAWVAIEAQLAAQEAALVASSVDVCLSKSLIVFCDYYYHFPWWFDKSVTNSNFISCHNVYILFSDCSDYFDYD